MTEPGDRRRNCLLAALPEADFECLRPHLQRVRLRVGQPLYEPWQQPAYLYFPLDCIISKVYVLQGGETGQVAVVGNEGVVGTALFMGGGPMPSRAVVQHDGDAYRLSGSIAKANFYRCRELQRIFLRYVQALLTQMGQTAVCNRHHTIEQQLCRWLLLSLDRLFSNEVAMTQEFVSRMLGVRREGVTTAARSLREDGLITCKRGLIAVQDRAGLEARSCECYSTFKEAYDLLFLGLETF